ncbi:MAG: GNAT family N-acetyltransferase [Lachnospiraceae bacterium]|nr:GNAT family N-acetyltransferase [Lachnospiraceae bacterium]
MHLETDTVTMIRVETDEQLKTLAEKANIVWHEFFPCILTGGQIDYMVEKFQSYDAMKNQMKNDGYEYYFITADDKILGYTGIKKEEERLFLSKLYLLKENRGKGYASEAFKFLINYCKENDLKSIYLTVNKQNEHTIAVYKQKGFEVIDTQVADIGNGYVMDDYIMELKLGGNHEN